MQSKEGVKTVLFDIETSPLLVRTWGLYEQNAIWMEKDWYILSFSYKFLGEKKVYTWALPDFKKQYKTDPENDIELVKKLHQLFEDADILVAHNGDSFDIKKVNARFIYHGLEPLAKGKSVDTKREAKKRFNFTSNKLDDLGEFLGLGRKIKTDKELWRGCMNGDMKSWNLMVKYNEQDVILLEKVYLRMRPWMDSHPNIALIEEQHNGCNHCGGHHLIRRGFMVTKTVKKQRLQCQDCGAWRTGKTVITQNQLD